jgi:hypothetical protein
VISGASAARVADGAGGWPCDARVPYCGERIRGRERHVRCSRRENWVVAMDRNARIMEGPLWEGRAAKCGSAFNIFRGRSGSEETEAQASRHYPRCDRGAYALDRAGRVARSQKANAVRWNRVPAPIAARLTAREDNSALSNGAPEEERMSEMQFSQKALARGATDSRCPR